MRMELKGMVSFDEVWKAIEGQALKAAQKDMHTAIKSEVTKNGNNDSSNVDDDDVGGGGGGDDDDDG